MPRIPRGHVRSVTLVVTIFALLLGTITPTVAIAATRLKPRTAGVQSPDLPIQDKEKASHATPGEVRDGQPADCDVAEIPIRKLGAPPQQGPGVLIPDLAPEYISSTLPQEVEPNGTAATATPIAGTSIRIQGNIFPGNDVDFYSFNAVAGDRVYAATMTSFSGGGNTDSLLTLFASDGTTVIETDNDDGSFSATSSSIAGAAIPTNGVYFLRVTYNASATLTIRPYDLYLQVRSGSPTAETEPNDTFPGQALPAGGWVSGATSSTTDIDFFSVMLNAGDTLFLSLDLDPERDSTTWNGQLGLGSFGTPPLVLVVNDGNTVSPNSEAYFMTVRATGTYGIFVGLPTGGTTFGTYRLSATVFPRVSPGTCTTYTSTNVPVAIPTGPAIVTSTLTVPGNPRIAKLRVNIDLTHNFMSDLDVQLTSPNGTTIGLFSDIGSTTAGSQTSMQTTLDDDAGVPIGQFTVVQGPSFKPELNYRLAWMNGTNAGGTWTLTIRDDAAGDGGTLNNWSLEICEDPQPLCGGSTPTTIFATDFESGAAGFTHTGTQDEWELGTPTFAPVTGANSGVNCWKTDLDNTYNASSNQELLSPTIALPASAPLRLTWAQKFQIESASFDHAFVEVREVGGGGMIRRVWEFLDGDMIDNVGNPTVTVQEASGWSICERDISAFAGKNVQIVFHLDSDTTVQRAGFAIDDVMVQSCPQTDLAITSITDSPDPVAVGGQLTYTVNAINNGPMAASMASVSLPLPAGTTFVSATAPGGWSTMAPSIGANGTVTFTKATMANAETAMFTVDAAVDCSVPNASTLSATATIGSATPDSTPGNNSAMTTTMVTNAAPTIMCPASITQANDAGQCSAVVIFAPGTTDDFGCTPTTVCSPASGSAFPVGTTTVSCTATDAAGQMASCTFPVTVTDTEAPTVTCPANMTANTAAGQCSAVVTYTTPTAMDNCMGATVMCSPASGSTFALGATTVTCTATDGMGLMGTCTFTVTVVDNQAPSVTCPANITTNTAAGQCSAVVTYTTPTATDNCPSPTVNCVPASGSTFQRGVTTVTCTASDGTNSTNCTFTVTVNDNQPPTVTCPANITTNAAAGQCSAVVTYTTPTATDNCMGATVMCAPASGSSFPVGTTTVTCTATDSSGLMGSCSFTVTVVDNQPPTVTCPANITASAPTGQCTATVTFMTTASDNCTAMPTIVCTPMSGSSFPVGITTVTCTAADASGNMSSCSFTVTVADATAPMITCPANITLQGTALNGCTVSQVVTYPAPVATDSCVANPMVTCVPPSGSVFNEGVTTVTCTASDGTNTAQCSFTVTLGAPFSFCAVGDGTGDTFQIVTDPTQPLYGYWRYHVAATNTTICGLANFVSYTPGAKLRAYDNNFSAENPTYFMDATFTSINGTVYIKRKNGTTLAILRDVNLLNDPPCN